MSWGVWLAGFVVVTVIAGSLGAFFGAAGVPPGVALGLLWGLLGYRMRQQQGRS